MSGEQDRDACCGHGLIWHHETRGCGHNGFSAGFGCPCRLTFDEALADLIAQAEQRGRVEALREFDWTQAELLVHYYGDAYSRLTPWLPGGRNERVRAMLRALTALAANEPLELGSEVTDRAGVRWVRARQEDSPWKRADGKTPEDDLYRQGVSGEYRSWIDLDLTQPPEPEWYAPTPSEPEATVVEMCTTPGCDGDWRYAAPGRGHIAGCTYPLPSEPAQIPSHVWRELAETLIKGTRWQEWRRNGWGWQNDRITELATALARWLPTSSAVERILAARVDAEAEASNYAADYDRRGERLWRLAALAGHVPCESDNDATAELVVADALTVRDRLAGAAAHPHKGPDDTDASMLREAAKRLRGGYEPGGSWTKQTVAEVISVVADLIDERKADR